jgi:hypothetical protein
VPESRTTAPRPVAGSSARSAAGNPGAVDAEADHVHVVLAWVPRVGPQRGEHHGRWLRRAAEHAVRRAVAEAVVEDAPALHRQLRGQGQHALADAEQPRARR